MQAGKHSTPHASTSALLLMALIIASSFLGSIAAAPNAAAAAVSGPQTVRMPNGQVVTVPAGTGSDVIAWIRNGMQPVLVPSGKLTPSSVPGLATERGPYRTLTNCLQPPAHLDLLHTSAKLLYEYGIAPRTPGMPLSKWLAMESHVKQHVCQVYSTNTSSDTFQGGRSGPYTFEVASSNWAGNIADQDCAEPNSDITCNDGTHLYTESDTDYYVECPNQITPQLNPYGDATAWTGVGGTSSSYELQQTGTDVEYVRTTPTTYSETLSAWYEYYGPQTENQQRIRKPLECNDHMYVQVYGNNCYNMINLTEKWSFPLCNGPAYSTQSAEAILERYEANRGVFYGADTTFYGAAVTDENSKPDYLGYNQVQHDYANLYWNNGKVLNTGSINNDPTDNPPDEYTINVVNPCGGASSCQ